MHFLRLMKMLENKRHHQKKKSWEEHIKQEIDMVQITRWHLDKIPFNNSLFVLKFEKKKNININFDFKAEPSVAT